MRPGQRLAVSKSDYSTAPSLQSWSGDRGSLRNPIKTVPARALCSPKFYVSGALRCESSMFPELCVAKVLFFRPSALPKSMFSELCVAKALSFWNSVLQKLSFRNSALSKSVSQALGCKSSVSGALGCKSSIFLELWVAKLLFPELCDAKVSVSEAVFMSSMFPRFVSLELCCRSTIFQKFSVPKGLYDIFPNSWSSLFPKVYMVYPRRSIFPEFSVPKGIYDIYPKLCIPGVLCFQRDI